jgi:hypothetical protein
MRTAPFLIAALLIAGCTVGCMEKPLGPNADGTPPTPVQVAAHEQASRERKCEIATLSVETASTIAALAIKKDGSTKEIVNGLVTTVSSSVDDYCEAVLAGGNPDAEVLAYRTMRRALAELRTRALGTQSTGPVSSLPLPVDRQLARLDTLWPPQRLLTE